MAPPHTMHCKILKFSLENYLEILNFQKTLGIMEFFQESVNINFYRIYKFTRFLVKNYVFLLHFKKYPVKTEKKIN